MYSKKWMIVPIVMAIMTLVASGMLVWGYQENQQKLDNEILSENESADIGLYPVCEDNKWGYVNINNQFVIPPQFDEAFPFMTNGMARVVKYDKNNEAIYGCINDRGELVLDYQYSQMSDFSRTGMACVYKKGEESGYSFIDEKGKTVSECRYDYAGEVTVNDIAHVSEERAGSGYKHGYIEVKSNWAIIPPQYDEAEDFADNGLACVGIKRVSGELRYGYIRENGKFVIKCQYIHAGKFAPNGLACVSAEDDSGKEKYGYIDKNGEVIIACQYDSAEDFASNGFARVGKKIADGYEYGYINEGGNLVIDFQYSNAGDFTTNGLAVVGKDSESGAWLIDESGNKVGDFECDSRFVLTSIGKLNAVYTAGKDNKIFVGYVDNKGGWVIPVEENHYFNPYAHSAEPFG